MAGNGIVTIMLLMLLLLVVGKADHFTSLYFHHPSITTRQAPAASPNPSSTPSNPASPQVAPGPLPINTPPAFPSQIPIDTPIAFPSRTPIDIPIIPRLPIPSIGVPKDIHCASMCTRSCSLQKTNRYAYMKCLGLCHINCTRGISDFFSDCTNNCVASKFHIFNLGDLGNLVNHVSSCYAGCMNGN